MTFTNDDIKRLVPEAKLIPWPHKGETGPDTWYIGIYCIGEKDRPETYPYTFRLLLATRLENEMMRLALEKIRDREWVENCLDPQWAAQVAREAIHTKQ